LAKTLDPFARGLQPDDSLFICTLSRHFFFIDVSHNSYFSSSKIQKKPIVAVEDYSCEPHISSSIFFDLRPPTIFANLSKQESNQLVTQRHLALGNGPKKQQTGLCQTLNLRLLMPGGKFRRGIF